MPYTIVKLANEPIVIVHISGRLDANVHFRIAVKVANLVDNIPGKIFRINDLTHARLDLLDMVDVVRQMTMGWQGTATDPRIISFMVVNGGNSSLVAAHLIRKWDGWRRVHVFAGLAQAVACARGPIIMETEETMRLMT